MSHRLRSRWISHKENPLFGINLTGFETDRDAICAEIAAVEAILTQQPWNSVLAVLDIARTQMTPELAAFINAHPGGREDPIRRLAIVGVSPLRRAWCRWFKKVNWPTAARFFDGHEPSKAWLIGQVH
jgi:hypothetical protein